ncbi:MAG TPA: type II toxin-antitoxin system Phd/YefM family antitoxin, partial [Rhodocyclaceae bacterium]
MREQPARLYAPGAPHRRVGRLWGKAGLRPATNVQYCVHTRSTKMDAITYTTVRANLASAMDKVCNDHEALIITRNG